MNESFETEKIIQEFKLNVERLSWQEPRAKFWIAALLGLLKHFHPNVDWMNLTPQELSKQALLICKEDN